MPIRVEIKGGQFRVTDVNSKVQFINEPLDNVKYMRSSVDEFAFFNKAGTVNITSVRNLNRIGKSIEINPTGSPIPEQKNVPFQSYQWEFADLVDKDNVAYVSADILDDLLADNLGFFFNPNPIETVDNNSKSAFGELLVAQPTPQFQGSFEYTVDNTELITQTVLNGGTVTQASAMGVVTTSTTTASSALLNTVHHAKYKSGQGGLVRFTGLFTSGVAATEQFIGLYDEAGSSEAFKNGYMIGHSGTAFGVHRFTNDVLTTVPAANFDDPLDGSGASGMTIDTTKINVFEIRFQYLGAGDIQFCVENPDTGKFFIFHRIRYANANLLPSVFNPNFRFGMWVNNKGTTSNLIMKSASYAYFIEGKTDLINIHHPHQTSGEKQKTSVTSEVAIFTIRNKASYASKTNFIDAILEMFSCSIEASSPNNLGKVRLVKNATLGGTPLYVDINTSDSIVDIDVAGTTVTGGKELTTFPLAGKNDRTFLDLSSFNFLQQAGDTITVAGSSASAATINASLLWKEIF